MPVIACAGIDVDSFDVGIGPGRLIACLSGLVILSCGMYGNVIRLLPALTIGDEVLDEGLDILDRCFDAVL